MAKFAGPNDDYICTGEYNYQMVMVDLQGTINFTGLYIMYMLTGSDSGHAWVYDKETGSVAGACNCHYLQVFQVFSSPNAIV
jgi:hypothetical protein